MAKYIFILGREPALSVAEIEAVLKRETIGCNWLVITPTYALVETNTTLRIFEQLAGTIKVAEVLGSVESVLEVFSKFILDQLNKTDGACYLGFSAYGIKLPWLNKIGIGLKHIIKEQGRRVRFVVSREPQLSSVVVAKNKLLTAGGFEFVIIPESGKLLIARTIWVQPFEEWGARDYGRPKRDAKSGMLPPKLARLMVNLSGAGNEVKLLDPFCGSGTVLQESAVLGYKNLTGTDISEQAIQDSKVNWEWLINKYSNIKSQVNLQLSDVFELPNKFSAGSFELIVTEPFLGPPLTGRENEAQLQQIQKDLTQFYARTLQVFSSILKVQGRVVMIWPSFQIGNKILKLDLVPELSKNNLKIIEPLPSLVPQTWYTRPGILLYGRAGQYVVREVVVLEKI